MSGVFDVVTTVTLVPLDTAISVMTITCLMRKSGRLQEPSVGYSAICRPRGRMGRRPLQSGVSFEIENTRALCLRFQFRCMDVALNFQLTVPEYQIPPNQELIRPTSTSPPCEVS